MSNKALITIVIPVYNRRNLIIRTLDSIAAQDYRPFNLIIVDNNSSDDSYAIINDWIHKNSQNGINATLLTESKPGASAARNRGLMEVTTPWTMFFDSDDTMRPNHISRAIRFILKNPNADIIGWNALLHRLDGSTKKLVFKKRNLIFNHLFHATLATQRYTIKTEFIKQTPGWDETIPCWNDYVLGVNLLVRKPHIVFAGKEITVDTHAQTESITGIRFSDKRGYWEFALNKCRDIFNESGTTGCNKWLVARRAILTGHYTSEGCGYGATDLEKLVKSMPSPYIRWALKRIHNHVAKRRRGTALLCYLLLFRAKSLE